MYHQFQTATTFVNLISFIETHGHKFGKSYNDPVRKNLMRTILCKSNQCLKLCIIFHVLHAPTVFICFIISSIIVKIIKFKALSLRVFDL